MTNRSHDGPLRQRHELRPKPCKPCDEEARLSNVMLTILRKMEVNAEGFVDSLGPVSGLI